MKMAYALGGAVAAAAAFGYSDHVRRQSALSAEHLAVLPAAAGTSDAPRDDTVVSGRVLEAIDVAKYTYLRLETAQGETWAAVSKAEIAVGASVTVRHTVRMEHFASTTLKRTFDVIYFGTLAETSGASAGLPAGHPVVGSNSNPRMGDDPGIPEALLDGPSGGSLPPGHPSMDTTSGMEMGNGQTMPAGHPGNGTPAEAMVVPKLAPASGPNGHTIADLFAKADRLVGARVRVRGMVTKVTPDVLGQTFLHLRDGSGSEDAKTNDLAVTTQARPARGDVVTFEGNLRTDADLGIGYRYPALLENATTVKE